MSGEHHILFFLQERAPLPAFPPILTAFTTVTELDALLREKEWQAVLIDNCAPTEMLLHAITLVRRWQPFTPVLAIANDPAAIQHSLLCGADDCLHPDQLSVSLPFVIEKERAKKTFRSAALPSGPFYLDFDVFSNHSAAVVLVRLSDGRILEKNYAAESLLSHRWKTGTATLYQLLNEPTTKPVVSFFWPDSHLTIPTFRIENTPGQQVELEFQAGYTEYQSQPALLCVINDVTERNAALVSLQKTLAELHNRNHELDNFVYKISHDLRAPLCSVQGLLNLITSGLVEQANIPEYLSLIENRIQKLDRYILDVLSYSKNLNAPLEVVSVPLEAIILESVHEIQQIIKRNNKAHVIIQVAPGTQIYSDPFRMKEILKALLSNAFKFMKPDRELPEISIEALRTPEGCLITVEDNGIGIPKEIMHRIFDMFFRGTNDTESSGMGLYIMKQALERIQGRVSVESKINTGTRFELFLPDLNPITALPTPSE